MSTDHAYLAGIIDGEGYFVVATNTRSFGIRVAVIDECLIDWLQGRFGGYKSRGGTTVTGNRVHVWMLQKQEPLLATLREALPYFVIKRQQAEAMIALIEHLQSPPWAGEVPSSKLSAAQRIRERRRERRQEWADRTAALRLAVREARHVGVKRVGL